jgi:hypothetical protein
MATYERAFITREIGYIVNEFAIGNVSRVIIKPIIFTIDLAMA